MLRKDFTRVLVPGDSGQAAQPARSVCTPASPGAGGGGGSGGSGGGGGNTRCVTTCIPVSSDSLAMGGVKNGKVCQTVCYSG